MMGMCQTLSVMPQRGGALLAAVCGGVDMGVLCYARLTASCSFTHSAGMCGRLAHCWPLGSLWEEPPSCVVRAQ